MIRSPTPTSVPNQEHPATNITTYEPTVENGRIKLDEAVRLPEHARVYVAVPSVDKMAQISMRSPRLTQPERAVDFVKGVAEEPQDAGLRR